MQSTQPIISIGSEIVAHFDLSSLISKARKAENSITENCCSPVGNRTRTPQISSLLPWPLGTQGQLTVRVFIVFQTSLYEKWWLNSTCRVLNQLFQSGVKQLLISTYQVSSARLERQSAQRMKSVVPLLRSLLVEHSAWAVGPCLLIQGVHMLRMLIAMMV